MLQNKFVYILAALWFLAAILFVFPNNEYLFVMVLLASGVCGICLLFMIVGNAAYVKLFNVLAMSLLLAYSVSSAMVILANVIFYNSINRFLNMFGMVYCSYDISMALFIILIVCLILMMLSKYEPHISNKFAKNIYIFNDGSAEYIFIGAAIVILAYFSGQIGFLGIQSDDSGQIRALGSLAFLIVPPLIPITALEIIKDHSIKFKLLLIATLMVFILLSIVFGRRILFYSILCVLIALPLYKHNPFDYIKYNWLFSVIGIVVLFVFLSGGFLMFFAMRIVRNSSGEDMMLFDLISNTIILLINNRSLIYEGLFNNIIERSYILSYLAGLVAAHNSYPPLLGEELYYAIKSAIPSLFFPEKLISLPKAAEVFVHPSLGLTIFDGNNTIISAGFNDFWIIGSILYPVLIVVIYLIIIEISYRHLPFGLFQIVLFRLLYQLLFVEDSLSSLLTVCLRDLMLVVIILYLLSLLIYLAGKSYLLIFYRPVINVTNE